MKSKHPLYWTWVNIRFRCRHHKHYAGRGISVCKRWDNFWKFVADMGPKPTPAHEIDRVDNNGNYTPENCRWATRTQQNKNRRDSAVYTIGGVTKHRMDWAKEKNMSPGALAMRIKSGMTPKQAITKPLRQVGPGSHTCGFCGKNFIARRRLKKHKRTFCSRECYHAARKGDSGIAKKGWRTRREIRFAS